MKNYLFFVLVFVFSISYGQNNSLNSDEIWEKAKAQWKKNKFNEKYPNYIGKYNYTQKDTINNVTFTVDSTEITITAMDRFGNILWKTDPWKDNKLPIYRHNRPVIKYFALDTIPSYFTNEKWHAGKGVISITYTNSQFGYVDRKTGEFFFLGQD